MDGQLWEDGGGGVEEGEREVDDVWREEDGCGEGEGVAGRGRRNRWERIVR